MSSRSASTGGFTRSTPSAHCSESQEGPRLQPTPSYIPVSGSILHVVGVCINRTGTERSTDIRRCKSPGRNCCSRRKPPAPARSGPSLSAYSPSYAPMTSSSLVSTVSRAPRPSCCASRRRSSVASLLIWRVSLADHSCGRGSHCCPDIVCLRIQTTSEPDVRCELRSAIAGRGCVGAGAWRDGLAERADGGRPWKRKAGSDTGCG